MMEEGHLVSDVMEKNVIFIDEKKTVEAAAVLMNEKKIGSVIITRENTPVGIITEGDFVIKIVSQNKKISTILSEVMSEPLLVIEPDKTIWEAAEIMRNSDIHRVVVQNGHDVVGIITATDIIKIAGIGSDSNLSKVADLIFSRHLK